MVLVDTSVWVDYLRRGDSDLEALIEAGDVLCHPFVLGELACGYLHPRKEILERLGYLPNPPMAPNSEVMAFIEMRRCFGLGLGFIDVHLLVSAALAGAKLWSRDKRLRQVAENLEFAYREG